jgi:TCP-1/cpn60 chaperonin family
MPDRTQFDVVELFLCGFSFVFSILNLFFLCLLCSALLPFSISAMPKEMSDAKIACLDFNLNRVRLMQGVKIAIKETKQLDLVQQREADLLKERLQKIIDGGANVILTTKVSGSLELSNSFVCVHVLSNARLSWLFLDFRSVSSLGGSFFYVLLLLLLPSIRTYCFVCRSYDLLSLSPPLCNALLVRWFFSLGHG